MTSTFINKEDSIVCLLCPHLCKLTEGKTGICGVRKNSCGKIELLTYGIISGMAVDPIEKKPLYHFFPGSNILSIGSWGCNMRCDFCQNYHISQNVSEKPSEVLKPEELLEHIAKADRNIGIAFTYNEPVIWFEFIKDVARLVKKKGFYTVMVTNGFVNEEILKEYFDFIDAFNVDLKAFNNEFYRKISGAELEPVKRSLKMIAAAGKHLEITTLVIPGLNDSASELENQVKWISGELGDQIPFHLSRYFPMYKRTNPATHYETLKTFYEVASGHLKYVYMGNTMSDSGQNTICPGCNTVITKRSGYNIEHLNTIDGKCSSCGKEIYRYFTFSSS